MMRQQMLMGLMGLVLFGFGWSVGRAQNVTPGGPPRYAANPLAELMKRPPVFRWEMPFGNGESFLFTSSTITLLRPSCCATKTRRTAPSTSS